MTELMNKTLISVIISFPEVILMLLMGFTLSNMKVEIKKVIWIGGIQATVAFIVLLIKIPYGTHTIIQMISLWFLVTLITNIKFYHASVPVLLGFVSSGIMSALIFFIANLLPIKVDYMKLRADFIYTFIFALPILFFLLLVLIIIKKKKYTLL